MGKKEKKRQRKIEKMDQVSMKDTESVTQDEKNLQYKDFLDSSPFALQGDGSQKKLFIHETLLKSKSDVLWRVCEGHWKEMQERCYTFRDSDITEELLISFVEWAYTGNYYDPDEGLEETIYPDSSFYKCTRCGETFTNDGAPDREYCYQCGEGQPDQWFQYPGGSTSTASTIKTKKVSERSVLSNIKLYAFADKYMIPCLKQLSRAKITTTLSNMETGKFNLGAVFSLLEYAFGNFDENDAFMRWLGFYASMKMDDLREDMTRLDELLDSAAGATFAKHALKNMAKGSDNPFRLDDRELARKASEGRTS
ncbi:MAG: hypothetical protein M1834_008010 [Cirrosporium novae-zelandiae]|nr:MAG: hypothetical protein M1834_008010 [Cirrosporium novae-zelandiae]